MCMSMSVNFGILLEIVADLSTQFIINKISFCMKLIKNNVYIIVLYLKTKEGLSKNVW